MIIRFLKLPRIKKRFLFEAAVMLCLTRMAIIMLPFRYIAPFLAKKIKGSRRNGAALEIVNLVKYGLRNAERVLPWPSKCLSKCIAGKLMLQHRGYPSVLCLGVNRDEMRHLHAHAWLRSNGINVTGNGISPAYKLVATFLDQEE